ncbi:MAG: hypothetical protein JXQ76_10420 [Campylobacterales bacterium]|nr:hypothetical protein [Campylobacterales bacterium]
MGLDHAHGDASLLSVLLVAIIYYLNWLCEWSLPLMLYYIPTPLAFFVALYALSYPLFRYLWRE